jgi:hypothetical protein
MYTVIVVAKPYNHLAIRPELLHDRSISQDTAANVPPASVASFDPVSTNPFTICYIVCPRINEPFHHHHRVDNRLQTTTQRHSGEQYWTVCASQIHMLFILITDIFPVALCARASFLSM